MTWIGVNLDQVEVVILDVGGCRYLQLYCWQPEGRRRLKLEQQWMACHLSIKSSGATH